MVLEFSGNDSPVNNENNLSSAVSSHHLNNNLLSNMAPNNQINISNNNISNNNNFTITSGDIQEEDNLLYTSIEGPTIFSVRVLETDASSRCGLRTDTA